MPLSAGTRLGPYEIQSALGAGGMGEVYRARDTRLERTVAIKILPEALAADPQFRERFDREARTISQLDHPHICALYDVGEQQGTAYLVMQYLEGETLADRIARKGGRTREGGSPPHRAGVRGGDPGKGPPLWLDEALTIAVQIASALDAAHRAGIVHRDLKPGNVMLTKAGAKLLDFGLAKAGPAEAGRHVRGVTVTGIGQGASLAPTVGAPVTAQGTILGTFQYMAPEQLEGKNADARTDIFAFGALLYEMLTGRKAFEGKSHASLVAAILEREPAPVSSLQPLTPSGLDRVVRKCLAKDPDARWQTVRDLHDELQWLTEGAQATVATAVAGVAPSRRRSLLPVVIAAMVSLAIGVAGMWMYTTISVPEPLPTHVDISTPATADPFSFALSPDGRRLAFVANDERGALLWVRALDQSTAIPVLGTEGASHPFWAPDGRALGFFAGGKLLRINLPGGAPEVLADAPIGRGGTWNADGDIVFAATSTTGLMRVPATGGTPVSVTKLATAQSIHAWPQFLPDGRRFLFTVAGAPEARGVYLASLDGGEPARILAAIDGAAYAPSGHLFTASQGSLAARRFDAAQSTASAESIPLAQSVGYDPGTYRSGFSVSAGGVLAYRRGDVSARQLVWIDRAGKPLGILGPPDESALTSPQIAPDGQRVAVFRAVAGNFDLWLVDVVRGNWSRFTFDAAIDVTPVWSPDGRRIVFTSNRNGSYGLFEKPADGSADERPLLTTPTPTNKQPRDWRSDGRFLLYTQQDGKTASDLWALAMEGDPKPFPVVQTAFDEVHGQFSPDGRWVAYASNETGRYEIYVRPFPESGGRWQVSTAGGIYPRWRRDGAELFYIAPDNALMAVPVRAGTDGRTFTPGSPVALFQTRLATGANVGIGGFASAPQYAVAADGRFLMNVVANDAAVSPITLILNWTALLPR